MSGAGGGSFEDLDHEGGEMGLCSCRGTLKDECSCDIAESYGGIICWCVRDNCVCITTVGFVAD